MSQDKLLKLYSDLGYSHPSWMSEEVDFLHVAASCGRVDVINFLVNEGCDLNKKAKDNLAPVNIAITAGNVDAVVPLMNAGVDINAINTPAVRMEPESL